MEQNRRINLVVLGDFNDTRESKTIKSLIGRGKTSLFDVRPAERNNDPSTHANPRFSPRNITWTHFFGREDSYTRIDYILVSQGMRAEWAPEETFVLRLPGWGIGSDHRPITAAFRAIDR